MVFSSALTYSSPHNCQMIFGKSPFFSDICKIHKWICIHLCIQSKKYCLVKKTKVLFTGFDIITDYTGRNVF